MIEEVRTPTVDSIRDELSQIESEAMLYSVPGVVDEEMENIRSRIEDHLRRINVAPANDPTGILTYASLLAVRQLLVERLWALHEAHLPEHSERLFLDDLCIRQGSPIYVPDAESRVRVMPLVDYTLGHPPSRVILPAGATVSFDIDGEEPRQTVIVAAEGGWRAEVAAEEFPRKGMLVGRPDDFDRWVASTLPSIRLDR